MISTGSFPYGALLKGNEPLDETSPVEPDNVYAITKYAGELLALRLEEAGGSAGRGRPASPRPTDRWNAPRRIERTFPSSRVGAPKQCAARRSSPSLAQPPRDYTYVDDVTAALAALAMPAFLQYELYNISTGIALDCREMIAALGEQFPGMRVSFLGEGGGLGSSRRPLSAEQLAETGWSPRYDIRSGLAAYVTWLRATATK